MDFIRITPEVIKPVSPGSHRLLITDVKERAYSAGDYISIKFADESLAECVVSFRLVKPDREWDKCGMDSFSKLAKVAMKDPSLQECDLEGLKGRSIRGSIHYILQNDMLKTILSEIESED